MARRAPAAAAALLLALVLCFIGAALAAEDCSDIAGCKACTYVEKREDRAKLMCTECEAEGYVLRVNKGRCDCAEGFFSRAPNGAKTGRCAAVASGFVAAHGPIDDAANTARECLANSSPDEAKARCLCNPGFFQLVGGQTPRCVQCGPTSYTDTHNNRIACKLCPLGKVANAERTGCVTLGESFGGMGAKVNGGVADLGSRVDGALADVKARASSTLADVTARVNSTLNDVTSRVNSTLSDAAAKAASTLAGAKGGLSVAGVGAALNSTLAEAKSRLDSTLAGAKELVAGAAHTNVTAALANVTAKVTEVASKINASSPAAVVESLGKLNVTEALGKLNVTEALGKLNATRHAKGARLGFLARGNGTAAPRPRTNFTFAALKERMQDAGIPLYALTGGLPPIEDVPGLEKGAANPLDAMVKLLRGLSKNEDFRELMTDTIPSNIKEALNPKDEDRDDDV